MGSFLNHPKIDKISYSGNGKSIGQDFQYAVSSMQGWRVDMEDAHQVVVSITNQPPFKDWSFFAVFDGHAGSRVAIHSSQNLLDSFFNTEEFKKILSEPNLDSSNLSENVKQLIKDGIIKGFLRLDKSILTLPTNKEEPERSGTTVTCVILTPEYIFFANLGDSRCVLSRKGNNLFVTEDHKPGLDKERKRIEKAGGSVMVQRVNGTLAVSRALGDFDYKNLNSLSQNEQLVSPEPDVYIVKRNETDDEFIVLACDGIYDVLDNLELCQWVRSRLQVTNNLAEVSNSILDGCLSKGSRDNMTIILITFNTAPKVDSVLVQKEIEYDKQIMELINKFFELPTTDNITKDAIDAELITNYLKSKENELEERTGGIHFARTQIHKVMDEKQRDAFLANQSKNSNVAKTTPMNIVENTTATNK